MSSKYVIDLRPQAAKPKPADAARRRAQAQLNRPVTPKPTAEVPAEPAAPAKSPPPATAPKKKRLPRLSVKRLAVNALKLAFLLAGAAFFLLLEIPLPERLIGIYFVASIIYVIDSQRTFIVAILFLVMVAVSSAVGQPQPASNYAVYAFYFLVIGLVAAIREQVSNRLKTDRGNSQLSD